MGYIQSLALYDLGLEEFVDLLRALYRNISVKIEQAHLFCTSQTCKIVSGCDSLSSSTQYSVY